MKLRHEVSVLVGSLRDAETSQLYKRLFYFAFATFIASLYLVLTGDSAAGEGAALVLSLWTTLAATEVLREHRAVVVTELPSVP